MINKKKIIILLGPPGAGKGTVSQYLKENDARFNHISLGSICRQYALEDTDIGRLIKLTIDQGNLIDIILVQMIINKIFENFIDRNMDTQCSEILILDGFPRTLEQVFLFLKLLKKYLLQIDFYIFFLYLENIILQKRLINRYICSNIICDKIYSCYLDNEDKNCLRCNSILCKRQDDTINIINSRLLNYIKEESEIIDYFNNHNIPFFTIDGNNTVEDIIDIIYEKLDLKNDINIKSLTE